MPHKTAAVRIVGVGASAGGLEALEKFLAQVPAASGLAYVVVQHLDPTQKAVLAQLLQRVTRLTVHEAADQMRVQADHVYVIAPNTELSVANGLLHLHLPTEPRGLRLPINVLFASLARDQGSLAIGVVLSGMGSDGTQGLQALKAVGGLCVVQQPTSAQFDAMPLSAIAAGCADIVALPGEMPARILDFAARDGQADGPVVEPGHAPQGVMDAVLDAAPGHALQAVFSLLQQRTRHDFSLYKPSTLHRRIERRMAIHGLATLADYV